MSLRDREFNFCFDFCFVLFSTGSLPLLVDTRDEKKMGNLLNIKGGIRTNINDGRIIPFHSIESYKTVQYCEDQIVS